MSQVTFRTQLKGFGNNTGIEVPAAALEQLGAGRRPPVRVSVNGYVYQSTIGAMNGMSLISLSKAHRDASGLAAGDDIEVTLELEVGDRKVDIPKDLSAALRDAELLAAFEALSYSKRKEFARQVDDAKTEETKRRRIAKVLDGLS